jgi:hypothetical protein
MLLTQLLSILTYHVSYAPGADSHSSTSIDVRSSTMKEANKMVHAKWHMDLERDDQDLKSGVKVTNIDCPCVTVVLVSSNNCSNIIHQYESFQLYQ